MKGIRRLAVAAALFAAGSPAGAECRSGMEYRTWFLAVPDSMVGADIHVSVTRAAGSYRATLYDPQGISRRSGEVTPESDLYFTCPAALAGEWRLVVGRPFAADVVCVVRMLVAWPPPPEDGDDTKEHCICCGLLGAEGALLAALFLAVRRAPS